MLVMVDRPLKRCAVGDSCEMRGKDCGGIRPAPVALANRVKQLMMAVGMRARA